MIRRRLLDEEPILLDMKLVMKFGIDRAAILARLETLVLQLERQGKSEHLFDGKWWIRATYDDWAEREFTWLSTTSVRRFFRDLEKQGIVISRQEQKSLDRSKWYAIDFDVLEELLK